MMRLFPTPCLNPDAILPSLVIQHGDATTDILLISKSFRVGAPSARVVSAKEADPNQTMRHGQVSEPSVSPDPVRDCVSRTTEILIERGSN